MLKKRLFIVSLVFCFCFPLLTFVKNVFPDDSWSSSQGRKVASFNDFGFEDFKINAKASELEDYNDLHGREQWQARAQKSWLKVHTRYFLIGIAVLFIIALVIAKL